MVKYFGLLLCLLLLVSCGDSYEYGIQTEKSEYVRYKSHEFKASSDVEAFKVGYEKYYEKKARYLMGKYIYKERGIVEPLSFRVRRYSDYVFVDIDTTSPEIQSLKPQIEDLVISKLRYNKETLDSAIVIKREEDRIARELAEKERIELEKKLAEERAFKAKRIKQLAGLFRTEKDEFDSGGRIWHKHKYSPKFTNRNGVFLYFQTNDGKPSNLRFVIQYLANDWLFIRQVRFVIDGKPFPPYIADFKRDHSGGTIWEWSDGHLLNSVDMALVEALASSKSAKMKLVGSQYHKIKNISKREIQRMKDVLDYYNLLSESS